MRERDYQALVRGEHELAALQASGLDCHAATSWGFDKSPHSTIRDRPFVDRHRLSQGHRRPNWPNNAPFAVCLTHDVDNVSALDPRMHLRRAAATTRHLLASREPLAARALRNSVWSLAHSVASRRRADPFHRYERWLEMEREVGAKSTFLFLPDSYKQSHYSDGGYRYADRITFDGQRCSV